MFRKFESDQQINLTPFLTLGRENVAIAKIEKCWYSKSAFFLQFHPALYFKWSSAYDSGVNLVVCMKKGEVLILNYTILIIMLKHGVLRMKQ